jgi:hypothetical protein
MKKLLLSFVLVIGLWAASFGQTAPATATKKETKTTQPAAAASPATAKATTAPIKKDGTPDMRYKANKESAAPVTHPKKDGTPDKRYKENKTN